VNLEALVEVGHGDPLALLDHDRLGGGEGLAVQREADDAGVVEDHRDVLDGLDVRRDLHAAPPGKEPARHGVIPPAGSKEFPYFDIFIHSVDKFPPGWTVYDRRHFSLHGKVASVRPESRPVGDPAGKPLFRKSV